MCRGEVAQRLDRRDARAKQAVQFAEARGIGYTHMRLDTVGEVMDRAIAMYRQMGFREIAPYRENPMPDVLYMELLL